jgi:hypothetical protein
MAEVPEPQIGSALQLQIETTAAAIALLDAQYPWLRAAQKRFSNRSPEPRRTEGLNAIAPC